MDLNDWRPDYRVTVEWCKISATFSPTLVQFAMPNFSYGTEPQTRVQQLLELLIDCANYDLDESLTSVNLDARWEDGEELHLAVETTLEDLRLLLYGNQKVSKKVKDTQRKEIGALLTHYLGEFLEIWCDRRVKKRGSPQWIFSLKLWSKDKTENLQQFQQQWQTRQPQNSTTDSAPSSAIAASNSPTHHKTTIGLETIAEILVWVGRDALVEQLKAKLLAPETPPKVLAIIGQGGIGKTSLAVKLLESVGVQLQPPALTATCPYEKALYFKTYPGTSFDGVADFLLRGLDMETAEPLKTGAEKIGKILEGLTKQRGVLVLDNLEDILHPAHHASGGKAVSAEWGDLLHALVYRNHRSQIILTSREFPADLSDSRCEATQPDPDLVFVDSLEGIEIDAGVELLRQRRLKDTEEDLRWVSQRVEGHVFLLTQLAAVARGKPGYLRKHPELVTKKAEPILQVQLERQSEAGRNLLRQMCVLRVGIDIQGLTFLRLYSEDGENDIRFQIAAALGQPAEFTNAELKETEEIVRRLVNGCLVQRRYDKQRGEWDYDLHRVIFEYLQAQYQAELPQVMEQVYQFYCTVNTGENLKELEDLRPVLERQYFAFQSGNYVEAIRLLIGTLDIYLEMWGDWNLLQELYEEILPHIDRVPQEKRQYYLMRIGWRCQDWGNWDLAEKYYQDALAIAQEQNNEMLMARLLRHLGEIEEDRSNWDAAERLYRQSLELRTELGDRSGMAATWGSLGDIESYRSNWDAAERLYRQSLELRTELGDRSGMASSWGVLGDIERNRGNWDAAERLFRQCLEVETELGDRSGMAATWGSLGDIESCRSNWDAAERLYRQSLELRTELGDRSGMASSWGVLGDIERNRGNWDAAERLFRQCLEVETELGDRSGMAEIRMNLGENELGKGNLDAAEQYLTEALAQMEELGMTWGIAETNYDFAQLWRKRGNEEIAQQHYQKAHQLFQQLGAAKDLERIETEWNGKE